MSAKRYLAAACGKTLGKAKVTGYCISLKRRSDAVIAALEAAVRCGIAQTSD
ncbi:MAG: hypothetical protein P3B98_13340 [Gemmatimonadota bacterium]|nr:hypothetical protein [Gemmatimonadota bacterium]